MTHFNALKFAFESFVTAFEPGNQQMLDYFFSSDVILINHSHSKQFTLDQIKTKLPNIQKKFQHLTSEIKDLILSEDKLAFRASQRAFYMPENQFVTFDTMNIYQLAKNKVSEWQIWEGKKVSDLDK